MENEKAKKILQSIRYATVATVDQNDNPWSAPVWYVFKDGKLYWWSSKSSQHQRNIERNSKAFITIFDSTAPEGEGLGLYIKATVNSVAEEILDTIIELYNSSTMVFKLDRENTTGTAPTRLYEAVAVETWLNDGKTENGFWEDIRVPISS